MSATVHVVATALATAAPHAWPHGDPNAIARSILNQPAYAHAAAATSSDAKPEESPLQKLWDWFDDKFGPIYKPLLKKFFSGIGHTLEKNGNAVSWAGLALSALAVAGLLYALIRLGLALVHGRSKRAKPASALALGERGTVRGWRDVAAEAAARGDYRFAIAALFAAAVAFLDDREIVRFDASRTAGEYRRVVRRTTSAASEPFDELARSFVRASFAEETATGGDFDGALRALDRFEPALAAAPKAS